MIKTTDPYVRKCAMCGKLFTPPIPEEWAYKKYVLLRGKEGKYYFCSWSCLRKAEREGMEYKGGVRRTLLNGPRVTLSRGGLAYAVSQSGMSGPRVSELAGMSKSYIRYLLKKDREIRIPEKIAEKIAEVCGVNLSVILKEPKKEDST